MITRATLSTIEQGLPKYRSMLAGNAAYIPPSFESIATANGTGSSATITFSSIPSTFQHLQLRFSMRSVAIASTPIMRFNGDSTAANYTNHFISADGSSVSASGGTAYGYTFVSTLAAGGSPTYPMSVIVDILDYKSTTKNKTIRTIAGMDNNNSEPANGNGSIALLSSLWINLSAINSITITLNQNFTTGSTFALYGIKGA